MTAFDSVMHKRQKLKELFPKIIDARTADEQEDFFVHTKSIMMLHMADEEKNFYKMLSPRNRALKDKIADAKHGHDEIRHYLAVLEKNNMSYEEWILTLGELLHALTYHLGTEEGIFALAKKSMKKAEFTKLVERMAQAEKKIFKKLLNMWVIEPS